MSLLPAGFRPPPATWLLPPRAGVLWWRWTRTVATAGALGFLAPAAAVAGLTVADAPLGVLAPVVLLAGAVHGAVLGMAQASALRQAVPGVSTRAWTETTGAGAVLAWALGLVAVGAPLAMGLLVVLGVPQWRVLRRHVSGAGRWVLINAGAWGAGLATFLLVAVPLWHEGQHPAAGLAVGLVAVAAMALTVAAVSGAGVLTLAGTQRTGWRCRPVAGPLARWARANHG